MKIPSFRRRDQRSTSLTATGPQRPRYTVTPTRKPPQRPRRLRQGSRCRASRLSASPTIGSTKAFYGSARFALLAKRRIGNRSTDDIRLRQHYSIRSITAPAAEGESSAAEPMPENNEFHPHHRAGPKSVEKGRMGGRERRSPLLQTRTQKRYHRRKSTHWPKTHRQRKLHFAFRCYRGRTAGRVQRYRRCWTLRRNLVSSVSRKPRSTLPDNPVTNKELHDYDFR